MAGKHTLRVRVTDQLTTDGLLSTRSFTLRERILSKLFGRQQRVTVLVPGNQVGTVEILQPEGDLTALADAVGVNCSDGDGA